MVLKVSSFSGSACAGIMLVHPDPNSSYIVGPCTCTETMALNGYINICILGQEFSNWSLTYSLG